MNESLYQNRPENQSFHQRASLTATTPPLGRRSALHPLLANSRIRALPALLLLAIVGVGGCSKGCQKDSVQGEGSTESQQAITVQASAAAPSTSPSGSEANTSATPGGNTGAGPTNSAGLDLATDTAGLSKTVAIVKTTKGTLKFRFYSKDAPKTVQRLSELIQSKFYDGLVFHRVIPDFIVQVGDPKSKNKGDPTIGTGGSGVKLKAEFNGRKHVRGTVAMARAADIDSADSQFYICRSPAPHLDEKYTVFGQVVDFGEKVADKDVLDRLVVGDEIVEMRLETEAPGTPGKGTK